MSGSAAMVIVALGGCMTTTTTVDHGPNLNPVLRNSSPSDMSELHIADTALDSGNIDLATNLFQKIIAADPKSSAGLTGLGNTMYTVGDFTRAGVYYARANQTEPKALGPLVGLARVAIRQRRFDDAIELYRKVLTLSPGDSLAEAGLGAALDMKGDHAAAQAELRSALKTSPGDPVLSINLGLSLVLGGNPREGANVLLDVTRFPSAPPQAMQDLALAYGMLGNDQAAAEILGRDLPKASVDDNLRFYEIQRDHLAHPGAAPAHEPQAAGAATSLPVVARLGARE